MTRFSDQTRGLLQVAAAGVLIGTLGVCVREAGQNAWVTVWFRCVVGAVTVFFLASQFGWTLTLPRNGRAWVATLACGLLMTLTWVLFFASLGHLSIAVATVVFQVQPLILMAWGVMVLYERVSLPQWASLVPCACRGPRWSMVFRHGESHGLGFSISALFTQDWHTSCCTSAFGGSTRCRSPCCNSCLRSQLCWSIGGYTSASWKRYNSSGSC